LHPHKLSRRDLIRLGIRTGAGAVGAGILAASGCGVLSPPLAGLDLPATPTAEPATVGVARGRDLYELTRRALDSIGGMASIVAPGETVFIKPNLLTAGLNRAEHTVTGEITKPEIVITAAEECLRAGAAHVTIGDGAQVERFDWEQIRTLDGSTHLAAEAARLNAKYDGRLTLACLNSDSPAWDPLPSPRTALGEIHVSSLVARADRIISIPVLKTHRLVRLSLSIKNFMGTTPIARYGGGNEQRGRFVLHWTRGGPRACVLDMLAALRPDLAIVDGSIGCEDYGPWVRPREGRTVDMRERLGDWLVLASTDLVAADATAARIISHAPAHVPLISSAYEQGLGQSRSDAITLVGPTLDELRVPWEPA